MNILKMLPRVNKAYFAAINDRLENRLDLSGAHGWKQRKKEDAYWENRLVEYQTKNMIEELS